ncbi:hypothetical protein H310_11492 [Aphanomyces invadans]|uniref:Uncharacterized protein n=1 Tax=Aphanomyces invadans TaxID=157072 RepID=A0A024TMI5_9STRA|nr:hypothetical protein H310_11492 [Aphanomyces invadans]ETV94826.1 hypothetical protein H310_11492 [Aphanomyces invadans]|eukprot:XP_008876417.1 hypothetical protein H310_11492 [Aphanomyces invadans]
MLPKLADRQMPLHRQVMHWVLLGHVAVQPWFDANEFKATSLWDFLVESSASPQQGLPTTVLSLWLMSVLLSSPTPCLDASTASNVLRALRQAIVTCTAELPSLVNPSDLAGTSPHAMLGHIQLADVIPNFTLEQVHTSFSTFLSHFDAHQGAGDAYRVDPLPSSTQLETFQDVPMPGFVVQQVELWIGSATSTTGGAGVRALRVTLRDEFGAVHVLPLHGDGSVQHQAFGTRHVFAVDRDEFITCIDMSCYENLHAKQPSQRRRTFLGAGDVVALRESRAKAWWYHRELTVEKEINASLHKQMHVQRSQILAFEKERRKWEHELQRRISKYATDRKASSELNMELHTQVEALELKVQDADDQLRAMTASSAELEGTVDDLRRRTAHTQQLERHVEELKMQLAEWDQRHAAELDRQTQLHAKEIDDLKFTWSIALDKYRSTAQPVCVPPHGPVEGSHDEKRVAELEKALKQKDQVIQVLKAMLERQQTTAEDKITLANSKYDHVKAINLALQRKVMASQMHS